MDLHHSITKAFSLTAFFGLLLASPEGGDGIASAHGVGPGPLPPAPVARSPDVVPPATAAPKSACDSGMVLIEGDYCPDADQVCARWMPDPVPYQNLRCAEYTKPVQCKGSRQHRRYCIDREEFVDGAASSSCAAPDASSNCPVLPVVNKSWLDAKALCENRGARLCKETEWEFACEGEDISPYPYGYKRDSSLCNFDKTDLGGPMEKLKDLRAPLDAFPDCKSPFGVHNMVGNVDEWVERENMSPPNRSALRGGWWLPGRNRCRAATTAHGEEYSGKQVGFRCCKDAAP